MKDSLVKIARRESAFALRSMLAGLSISIGAIIFLQVTAVSSSIWLKALGALFFNIGLLSVIFFEFRLFTGMNADIVDMKPREWYKLPLCFIYNSLGIWLGALLIFKVPPIGSAVIERAAEITATKLDMRLDIVFVSSIMCGILITLAVMGYRRFKDSSPVAGIIAVIFPIFVFVMIGVDHSVANQMYFALNSLGGYGFSGKIVLHTFIVMIGNILGGMLIPAIVKLYKWLDEKRENNSQETGDSEQ